MTSFSQVAALACASASYLADAQCLPMTGCERPEFAAIDNALLDHMCENDIPGATLAVAYDGVVIYERGFGTANLFQTEPMQPDAMMRIASVSKPLTASAIRELVTQGVISLGDYAFDLGQPGGTGLLTVSPSPSLGDPRLADIRVIDLLHHRGGWNRDLVGDWVFVELLVAREMGVAPPPGQQSTIDWILGQPLQYTPSTDSVYSNISYLVLGMIVEQYTGMPVQDAIQQLVLDPLGIPDEDHDAGRTFLVDQNPREPWYHAPRLFVNVFDPTGPLVPSPYGAWDHESIRGLGGQITTAATLAKVAAHRWVNGENIGRAKLPTLRGNWRWNHTGLLDGTGSIIRQRSDGITYAVIANARTSGTEFRLALDPVFDDILPILPTSQPNCCNADTNNDGALTPADYNAWIIAYNNRAPACDQNADGSCTPADFNAWILNFNTGC